MRPWPITKACIRGGSRQPRLSQISLCLWEGFGLQITSFGVFKSQTTITISLGSASSSSLRGLNCFKEFLSHGLIRV